jgi:hypothetical protein
MKTSTVKEITKVNEWDWPHGKVFYINMKMENWDTISLGKKTEDAFKVGDSISWEDYSDASWKIKQREVKENPFRPQANNQANCKAAKIWMAIKVAFDLVYKDKWLDEAKKLTKEILLFATELEWESDSPSS